MEMPGHVADRHERFPLAGVRMASPCPASWEEMRGDERVRFCGICQKKVFNLCAVPMEEARRLIEAHEGKLCALVYGRRDGTLLLEDCPVGVAASRRRLWRRAIATVGAAILALLNGQTQVQQRKQASPLAPHIPGAAAHLPERQLSPETMEQLKLLGSLGYID